MSPVKAFCLSIVAATALMAFAQVAPAMATNTQICKLHQEPCAVGNRVTSVHFVSGTTLFLSTFATALCLSSLLSGTVGPLAAPQKITVTTLTFTNCGTTAEHNNCTVKTLKLGEIDVLKTALNLGTATWLNLEVLISCPSLGIHCIYGGAAITGFTFQGALHTAETGNGKVIGSTIGILKVSGGLLCPEQVQWHVAYEALEHLFLVS
jgi:hypothetical protein